MLNAFRFYLFDLYGYFLLLMTCDSWIARQGAIDPGVKSSSIQVVSTDRHVLQG
jgi:hypothetical protein